MEIEIGEYIRTEFGNIGKYYRPASESGDVYCIYINKEGLKISTRYDSITKHSKNILDIIEKGDLIKIKLKSHHKTESIYEWKEAPDNNSATWKRMLEQIESDYYEIVSIITKEEFKNKNIGYKVEE